MRERTILAALAVLVSASSAIGLAAAPASAEERGAADSGARAADGQYDFSVETNFNLNRISLINGKAIGLERGGPTSTVENLVETIEGTQQRGFAVRNRANSPDINFTATWQVKAFDKATDYWVVPHVEKWWDWSQPKTHATCDVYKGEPAHGGKVLEATPFLCTTALMNGDKPRGGVNFDVRMNRLSEVSGEVQAVGDVSLKMGRYLTGVPQFAKGATDVDSGTSTKFDVALLEGEENKLDPDNARMAFFYTIYDNGVATPYMVDGYVTNHRSWIQFTPAKGCQVRKIESPTEPLINPPYTCSVRGEVVSGAGEDGNGHYRAKFTVGKR